MLDKELINKYEELINLIQIEYERNKSKLGNKIKCRKGCVQCCYQIFKITILDSDLIKNYIDTLSLEAKDHLKYKANNYLVSLNNSAISDDLKLTTPPCPALSSDGECTIYEARPIICRRFGPPIYDYKAPDKIFACEINFQHGEEIIDDDLIPNQTIIGKKWDELKEEYNIKQNAGRNFTTIAEAILQS